MANQDSHCLHRPAPGNGLPAVSEIRFGTSLCQKAFVTPLECQRKRRQAPSILATPRTSLLPEQQFRRIRFQRANALATKAFANPPRFDSPLKAPTDSPLGHPKNRSADSQNADTLRSLHSPTLPEQQSKIAWSPRGTRTLTQTFSNAPVIRRNVDYVRRAVKIELAERSDHWPFETTPASP